MEIFKSSSVHLACSHLGKPLLQDVTFQHPDSGVSHSVLTPPSTHTNLCACLVLAPLCSLPCSLCMTQCPHPALPSWAFSQGKLPSASSLSPPQPPECGAGALLPDRERGREPLHLLPAAGERHALLQECAHPSRGGRRWPTLWPGLRGLQQLQQHHLCQLEPVLHQLLPGGAQPLQGRHQLRQHRLCLDRHLPGGAAWARDSPQNTSTRTQSRLGVVVLRVGMGPGPLEETAGGFRGPRVSLPLCRLPRSSRWRAGSTSCTL